jgi:hypothetical protein
LSRSLEKKPLYFRRMIKNHHLNHNQLFRPTTPYEPTKLTVDTSREFWSHMHILFETIHYKHWCLDLQSLTTRANHEAHLLSMRSSAEPKCPCSSLMRFMSGK